MCGRARCSLESAFSLCPKDAKPKNFDETNYQSENIGPGTKLFVTIQSGSDNIAERHVEGMIWGLIPSYLSFSSSKDNNKPDHYNMINCRVESASKKVSFKNLLSKKAQRCIFSIDGFYEWKQEGGIKQPYYLLHKSEKPLYLAGLYDECIIDGKPLKTFTILTTESASNIQWLHNRQPVILFNTDQINQWLDPSVKDVSYLLNLFQDKTWINESMKDVQIYPVTPKVNSIAYKGEDCIRPLKQKSKTLMQSYFKPTSTHTNHTVNNPDDGDDDHNKCHEFKSKQVEDTDKDNHNDIDINHDKHVDIKQHDDDYDVYTDKDVIVITDHDDGYDEDDDDIAEKSFTEKSSSSSSSSSSNTSGSSSNTSSSSSSSSNTSSSNSNSDRFIDEKQTTPTSPKSTPAKRTRTSTAKRKDDISSPHKKYKQHNQQVTGNNNASKTSNNDSKTSNNTSKTSNNAGKTGQSPDLLSYFKKK